MPTQTWKCECCNKVFNSQYSYQKHLESVRHKKISEIPPIQDSAISCKFCVKTFTGTESYHQHVISSDHLRVVRNMEKRNKIPLLQLFRENAGSMKCPECNVPFTNWINADDHFRSDDHIKVISNNEKLDVLSNLKPKAPPPNNSYQSSCNICNILLSGERTAKEHYEGKMHKKNMKKLTGEVQEKLLELPNDTNQASPKVIVREKCSICDVPLCGEKAIKDHYAGRKHKNKQFELQNECSNTGMSNLDLLPDKIAAQKPIDENELAKQIRKTDMEKQRQPTVSKCNFDNQVTTLSPAVKVCSNLNATRFHQELCSSNLRTPVNITPPHDSSKILMLDSSICNSKSGKETQKHHFNKNEMKNKTKNAETLMNKDAFKVEELDDVKSASENGLCQSKLKDDNLEIMKSTISLLDKKLDPSLGKSCREKSSEKQEKILELPNDTNQASPKGIVRDECSVCNVPLSGEKAIKEHYVGKKHMKKLSELQNEGSCIGMANLDLLADEITAQKPIDENEHAKQMEKQRQLAVSKCDIVNEVTALSVPKSNMDLKPEVTVKDCNNLNAARFHQELCSSNLRAPINFTPPHSIAVSKCDIAYQVTTLSPPKSNMDLKPEATVKDCNNLNAARFHQELCSSNLRTPVNITPPHDSSKILMLDSSICNSKSGKEEHHFDKNEMKSTTKNAETLGNNDALKVEELVNVQSALENGLCESKLKELPKLSVEKKGHDMENKEPEPSSAKPTLITSDQKVNVKYNSDPIHMYNQVQINKINPTRNEHTVMDKSCGENLEEGNQVSLGLGSEIFPSRELVNRNSDWTNGCMICGIISFVTKSAYKKHIKTATHIIKTIGRDC